MFQTFLLSLMAFLGFAPATPRAARVGPGPNGRRHAILPTPATISTPSTGPGPGGRRRALYETPRPRVAQPVVQPDSPVALRNKPTMRELRERAYALGIRTTETVRSIPAGLAVRYLQSQAGCAPSQDGLGRVTRFEAEAALGRDLVDYIQLCIGRNAPIPSISPSREKEDDAVYRVRLNRACVDDIELWETAARERDRQRAEAQEAGIPQPDVLRIPGEVEKVIAQRAAAQLAMLKRRKETQSGAAGAAGNGGSNVVSLPGADQAPAPDGPPPEGHDVPSVPAGPK